MLRVAIVEDEREDRTTLRSHLQKLGNERKLEITAEEFANGRQLVEEYHYNFDVIFLDIEMEGLDGMDTARLIRSKDREVLILFITNLAQYAIEGYEVEAVDFIVKPVSYAVFSLRMERVLKRLKMKENNLVPIRVKKETVLLNARDIQYAETMNKKTVLHMGQTALACSETMNDLQGKLEQYGFYRCHNAFLVNMNAIERLSGFTVVVGETEIPVSKYRKKDFWQAVARYEGMLL